MTTVDQVRLHFGRQRALPGEAPSVPTRAFVLEVPPHLALKAGDVGVDEQGRRRDWVGLRGAAEHDPVLGLDTADLADSHTEPTIPPNGRCVGGFLNRQPVKRGRPGAPGPGAEGGAGAARTFSFTT